MLECIIFLIFLRFVGTSTVLFTIEGTVLSEEYNYYKVFHPGNIQIRLDSLSGDADLYVTSKEKPPTYDPETYDFQSATCGTDAVIIPYNVRRPLAVGVYGHFSYNESSYVMYIEQLEETNDFFDEGIRETTVSEEEPTPKKVVSKVKKKLKNIPNSLWPFLELFEILFF